MTDFDQLIHDIEQEAIAEGPEAVAALRSLDSQLHIAGQLLALRHRRGLTQRRLSELSGVQQADISRIERGETQPTTVTARRLANALGADFGFYEIDITGRVIPVEPASVKSRRSTLADNSAIEWTEATWNPGDGLRQGLARLRALLCRDIRGALARDPGAPLRAGVCAQALARAVGAAVEQHRWALLGTARYLLPDRAQALADRAQRMLERGESCARASSEWPSGAPRDVVAS